VAYPPVVIVDEKDEVVGAEMLPVAWERGLYHRIVAVMVEDEAGRILLQHRSPNMVLYPDMWDNSAAGHVDEGFTYETAALQELEEELGISGFKLEEIATYRSNERYGGRILNRFNRVYRVRVPADTAFRVEPEEVSEVRWFTPAELRALIAEHPQKVAEGLAQIMGQYYPV
jgi:isopentenyldiphosphate isomerase